MYLEKIFILSFQVAFAPALGWSVFHLLKPALNGLLDEVCGGELRAAFWVAFTRLMLLISPLLLVVIFAQPEAGPDLAVVLRETLVLALGGAFVGLAVIGGVIWHSSFSGLTPRSPASE